MSAEPKENGGSEGEHFQKSPERARAPPPPFTEHPNTQFTNVNQQPGLRFGLRGGAQGQAPFLETASTVKGPWDGDHLMERDTGLASCPCPWHLSQMPSRSDQTQETTQLVPRTLYYPGVKSMGEFRTSLLGSF